MVSVHLHVRSCCYCSDEESGVDKKARHPPARTCKFNLGESQDQGVRDFTWPVLHRSLCLRSPSIRSMSAVLGAVSKRNPENPAPLIHKGQDTVLGLIIKIEYGHDSVCRQDKISTTVARNGCTYKAPCTMSVTLVHWSASFLLARSEPVFCPFNSIIPGRLLKCIQIGIHFLRRVCLRIP